MVYAVIDTNVMVSALLARNANSATVKIVECMAQGKITPLYHEEILTEYEEVLSREKFHIDVSVRKALLEYIRKNGVATERAEYEGELIDPDDRVFYEVALSDEDSFLVTGNLKHFPHDVRVVTPAQMLLIIEEQEV